MSLHQELASLPLPDCVDRELWEDFIEVRRKMGQRAPLTHRGARMILMELVRFNQDGYDANEALRSTVMNGWRGVFRPKEKAQRPIPVPADGKPKVIVLNNFLVDQAEHEALLSKPEEAEKARAARLAAMQKIKGRAA